MDNEWKVLKGLEFAYVKLSTTLGENTVLNLAEQGERPAIVAIKRVEELLRPFIINKRHARMLQIGGFFLQCQ